MSEELSHADLKKQVRELEQRLSESNSIIDQFKNKDKNYKANIFGAIEFTHYMLYEQSLCERQGHT